MSEVTQSLEAMKAGDPQIMEQLLPQVYDELRQLAAAKLVQERDGHTLDATALVHEAWLRLGKENFTTRSMFIRAAAEAMRRVLVDHARAKKADKRGGGWIKNELVELPESSVPVDLIALDEALSELEQHDPAAAELVKLRYFSGFSHIDAAEAIGLSRRQADGLWALARAWLFRRLHQTE